jgi:hypothetical protein
LCSDWPNEILEQLKPGWNDKVDLPVKEKLFIIHYSLFMEASFHGKKN